MIYKQYGRKRGLMRISKNILEETINIVTGQRQEDYGDKITNHQNIANLWSSYLDKKYQHTT